MIALGFSLKLTMNFVELASGLVVQDSVLSRLRLRLLLWLKFTPWPRNFSMPWAQQKGEGKKRADLPSEEEANKYTIIKASMEEYTNPTEFYT